MKDILTFWGWWTSLRLWLLHRKLHKYTELYLELQGGFLDLSLRPLTLKILHFEWCPSFVRAGKVWVEVKIIVDRVVNQEMCISSCSTWRFWVMLKSKQSRLAPSSSKSNKRPRCLPLRLRAPLPVYAAASGPQRARKPGQVNRSVIFLSIKRGPHPARQRFSLPVIPDYSSFPSPMLKGNLSVQKLCTTCLQLWENTN